jgi:RNA polymerase sigma-70 factor (family 1)
VAKTDHTERQLLLLAASGDGDAFTTLFHAYKHPLYSYLFRLGGSSEIAEDVIQELFLNLWDNRQSLADIQQFRAYIFRAAQHRIINVFRRQAKEVLILAELQSTSPASTSGIEDQLSLSETRRRLKDAIEKLSPQQKLVYNLSRNEGLAHEEIAQQLHISRSTVNNHMIRALQVLRAHLNWLGSFF